MREFDPDQLLFLGVIHAVRAVSITDGNSILDQKQRTTWLHDAEAAGTLCHKLGLTYSELSVQRIKDCLSLRAEISYREMIGMTDELDHRIIDEMKSRTFFSIEPNKRALLSGTDLFGSEVAAAFPSANLDIEESGRCQALERWTASVFHSMRVLEIGLTALAKDMGIIKIDYKTWESLIQDIEKQITAASAGDKLKEQFYSEAALQFRYFKNAWRNHVMHVRDTYDEQRAETIFGHVKEFMVHLSTRLKEVIP